MARGNTKKKELQSFWVITIATTELHTRGRKTTQDEKRNIKDYREILFPLASDYDVVSV